MNVNTNFTHPGASRVTGQPQSPVLKRGMPGVDRPAKSADDIGAAAQSDSTAPESAISAGDVISDDEKKFFQELFPTAAEEIRTYTPYQSSGHQQPARLGTLIDAKG